MAENLEIPTGDNQETPTNENTEVPAGEPEGEPEVVLPSDEVIFEMPDKFAGKSAEEIAKSYMELEALRNKPEETPEQLKEENEEPNQNNADSVEELIEHYVDRGTELTEEDYKTLEEKGYSKKQVDRYANGIKAEQQAEAMETLTEAGVTLDEVNQSLEFARDNWDEARIERTNTMLASSDRNVQIQALQMLQDAYSANSPQGLDGNIHSNTTPQAPSQGYDSMEQMIVDMSDPRYDTRSFKHDPAFYKAVRDKAAKSDF